MKRVLPIQDEQRALSADEVAAVKKILTTEGLGSFDYLVSSLGNLLKTIEKKDEEIEELKYSLSRLKP